MTYFQRPHPCTALRSGHWSALNSPCALERHFFSLNLSTLLLMWEPWPEGWSPTLAHQPEAFGGTSLRLTLSSILLNQIFQGKAWESIFFLNSSPKRFWDSEFRVHSLWGALWEQKGQESQRFYDAAAAVPDTHDPSPDLITLPT